MDRRTFLRLAPAAALATATPALAAGGFVEYRNGLVQQRLAAGETVFVDFFAPWCGTCRSQSRTIAELMAGEPRYAQAVTFVRVDWDSHANGTLSQSLKIPRRSTLVVLKGNRELGRVVASTRRGDIKALMDTALAAATA